MTVQTTHIQQQGLIETRTYASPLMSPSDMARLNDVMENGAQQYFDWVKSQTEHRQKLEAKRLNAQILTEHLGQVFGLLITLSCVGAAFYLGTHGGDPKVAIALVGGPLLGIVTVFVSGRWIGKSENVAKTKILSGQPSNAEKQS